MSTQTHLADVEHVFGAFRLAFAVVVSKTNRAALAICHVPALSIPFNAPALLASLSSLPALLLASPF
jgi:hypothetical protein